MKRLVVVAALAGALAACGNPAEEADEPAVAETTVAAVEAPADSTAGTYEVTMPDGTKMTSVLNPDGTYQDTDAAGTVTESGTWTNAEGKTCFTPTGGGPAACFLVGEPEADGTMVATPDDGTEAVTIKKVS